MVNTPPSDLSAVQCRQLWHCSFLCRLVWQNSNYMNTSVIATVSAASQPEDVTQEPYSSCLVAQHQCVLPACKASTSAADSMGPSDMTDAITCQTSRAAAAPLCCQLHPL
jgi:hypothetical protein